MNNNESNRPPTNQELISILEDVTRSIQETRHLLRTSNSSPETIDGLIKDDFIYLFDTLQRLRIANNSVVPYPESSQYRNHDPGPTENNQFDPTAYLRDVPRSPLPEETIEESPGDEPGASLPRYRPTNE